MTLNVEFLGKSLASPLIAASGTFGFGQEYNNIVNLKAIGGISSKGLTLNPKYGNEGERLFETPFGLINSIGLQNPGIEYFIKTELPQMKALGTAIFANLGGGTAEDYVQGCRLLCQTDIDFIELNISCPNVKEGGIAYGVKAKSAFDIVNMVRKVCTKPLVVKMSPNAESIPDMAAACEDAGADALSLVNTFQAMAIDINTRRPIFNNVFAGLSGPAIKPIALRMVYQACKTVKIPVIGLGGILTAADAIEFILAGAVAVQIGTANFIKPNIMNEINDGIKQYMIKNNINSLAEICGAAL